MTLTFTSWEALDYWRNAYIRGFGHSPMISVKQCGDERVLVKILRF